MKRGTRSDGIPVDPARVREARLQAGLSLGQVAGQDVSRTHIHLIEHGKTRPSQAVLELIASRTRKPTSYFILEIAPAADAGADLVDQLKGIARRVRQFGGDSRITPPESEAMKLLEVTLRQGAELVRSIQASQQRNAPGRMLSR